MLSVVIPTCNRATLLARTLASLESLQPPTGGYEILVVDTASTDTTPEVCAAAARRGLPLRYERADKPGQHIGRNRGALQSRGEILVFADDDIRAAPTWLTAFEEAFQDPAVGLAGGPALPDYEAPPPAWVEGSWRSAGPGRALWYFSLVDAGDQVVDIPHDMILGCNFAIRRQLVLDLGGFPPDVMPRRLKLWQGSGETGVAQAACAQGLRARYHPGARVDHFVSRARMSLGYLFRRGEYQGIVGSFMELRQQGGLAAPRSRRREARKLARLLFAAAGQARRTRQSAISPELAELAHQAGWALGYAEHRWAVAHTPALARWVLRPDYLDESASPS